MAWRNGIIEMAAAAIISVSSSAQRWRMAAKNVAAAAKWRNGGIGNGGGVSMAA